MSNDHMLDLYADQIYHYVITSKDLNLDRDETRKLILNYLHAAYLDGVIDGLKLK